MNGKATLSVLPKQDIRTPEQRVIDELVEFKKQSTEKPRNSSVEFNSTVAINPPLVFTQDFKVVEPLLGLQPGTNNFLILNSGTAFSGPNFPPLAFANTAYNQAEMFIQSILNTNLVINGSFFRVPTANSFASDFSFDLFVMVAQVTTAPGANVVASDYNPFLQVKVGTISYTASSNTFSSLLLKISLNLRDFTNSQNFTDEERRLIESQYLSLINSNIRLSCYVGFRTSQLNAAQLNFMSTVQFQNNISIKLINFGTNITSFNIAFSGIGTIR